MAKKAELEASFRATQARCAEAARAEADGDFSRVLERAEAAIPLLRESIAFLRRYHKVRFPNLPAVDLILRYAPPLFARRSLDAIDRWFAGASRAERAAYPDLADRLAAARRLLDLAVRVWPCVSAAARQPTSAPNTAEATRFLDLWVRMGAVARRHGSQPPAYEPVTHQRRQARGKCPRCARSTEAAWAELLFPFACPHCRATGQFVLVARIA